MIVVVWYRVRSLRVERWKLEVELRKCFVVRDLEKEDVVEEVERSW
jgi:hypothetical protein